MLRTLKATEDATAEPASQNIYMLCDMAMAMAPAIVERHSPGDVVTGKFRCTLLLPKPFFRSIMTGEHSCCVLKYSSAISRRVNWAMFYERLRLVGKQVEAFLCCRCLCLIAVGNSKILNEACLTKPSELRLKTCRSAGLQITYVLK